MNLKPFFFFAFVCIFSLNSLAQNTYYVDTNGSNSNTGAFSSPWATLQYAAYQTHPGDTVFLRGGTYPAQFIILQNSGTEGNPVTFKNYPQENPILDGSVYTNQTMLLIKDLSHIVIDGLTFKGLKGDTALALFITGISSNITVKNCTFTNLKENTISPYSPTGNLLPLKVCGSSNLFPITNISINNNHVYDCKTGYSEGISISGNVDGFVVENNLVHDISNIGIVAAGFYNSCAQQKQARNGIIRNNKVYRCRFPNLAVNATAAGIYIDGARNVVAEKNLVYECQVGIQIGSEVLGGTANNDTIRNNVTYNNDRWGIGIGANEYPEKTGKVQNSALLNNTVFSNGSKNADYPESDWYGELNLTYAENSTVQNNIFYANTHNRLYTISYFNMTGNSINHNLVYANQDVSPIVKRNFASMNWSTYKSVSGHDANSIFDNPNFNGTNVTLPELHFKSNSPAINAGNPLLQNKVGSQDKEGHNRYKGIVDIGAYEHQCPDDFKIKGDITNTGVKFETLKNIVGNNTITSGASAIYQSAKSIELLPNFKANYMSTFLAVISGCSN
jgi:hypothetical protein